MEVKRLNDNLFEISNDKKKARIERGPRRITAKATKELLDDKNTASHYFAGERDATAADAHVVVDDAPNGDKKPGKITGRDATGKPIKLGEPMTYIDLKNRKKNPVWYVYLHDGQYFQHAGEEETYDAALSAALNLVA